MPVTNATTTPRTTPPRRPPNAPRDAPPATRVLILDADAVAARALAEQVQSDGYATTTAADADAALAQLDDAAASQPNAHSAAAVGVVVVDAHIPAPTHTPAADTRFHHLPGGFAFLKTLRNRHPAVVPIMVTGFGKLADAVQAVRLGASDYLTKPVVDEELRLAVDRAANHHVLVAENQSLRDQLQQRFGMGNLVGGDYRMQRVYDLIEAVADSRSTILITGESGTGKTVVARAIHTQSARAARPFVTFACGSIPENLLESELFGHVKGAFTGADADKPGKLLAADGGTLLIDEINSATPALQLKLLHVLQDKAFEPLGSTRTVEVDVRFVIASNADLAELVKAGQFREDLYYRINVVNLELPSLRERQTDVPLLAEHFLHQHCDEMGKQRRLSPEVVEALSRHDWPGNIRELENAIERAVLLSKELMIGLDDLPQTVTGVEKPPTDAAPGRALSDLSKEAIDAEARELGLIRVPALRDGWSAMPLEQAMLEPERQIILAALRANDWNRSRTADELGINRTTLYKKIKQLGIDPA